MTVTVEGDPFSVTYPNGGETIASGCVTTVTWTVGGGDVASNVNIWISPDGGYTHTQLLMNTPNDGSAEVTMPCQGTSGSRIIIAAVGNIFFDISDDDFTIESEAPQFSGSTSGGAVDDDCERLVTFAATITDDCSILTGDVLVSVGIPTGNASFGSPTINKVQSDDGRVDVTGSVLVYGLTGSPATVEITYGATDNCGNFSSTSYSADVFDDIDPVIACPSDLTFECDNIGDFGFPTATDNCDLNPQITLIVRDSIPGDCPQEYQLALTYRAEDVSGNTTTCQQTITVEDTTDPVITCPDTLEFVFTSPTQAQVIFEISATDNCADTLEIVCDSVSGSTFVIGKHRISCSVDDGCGNADSCSFSFRLVPLDIKPRSCPNPLNVKGGGPTELLFSNIAPLADDDPLAAGGAVVPVAILGTADFDVSEVDVTSLRLEGIAPVMVHFEDVATPVMDDPTQSCECTTADPDGLTDLVLQFSRSDLIAAIGAVNDGDEIMLTLTGSQLDGILLAGGDCVIIRGRKTNPIDPGSLVSGNDNDFSVWNSPNPFNPSTTISYRLPQAGEVSLTIYNVLGQEIRTLIDDYQAAGEYSVEWSGHDASGKAVASGIYFYRLQVANNWLTRKMMLLK